MTTDMGPDTGRTATPGEAPAPAAPVARRHRWGLWLALGALLVAAAFVAVWFQPQKLWIDDRVDQAVPTARPEPAAAPGTDAPAEATTTTTTAPEPRVLRSGEFVSLDHGTTGTARVLELADGRRFVRLEGFETDNGPDLYVYLSTNRAEGDEGAFDDDIANLGRLQGNIGDQNYELPAGVDPARFTSVVVWCDRFDSAFGAADLS